MLDAAARGSWDVLAERLGAFIARRVPPQDVDDVLQEVLLRIHRSVRTLEEDSRFGPWVYSIARNAIIDRLRRKPMATAEVDEHAAARIQADDPVASPLLDCVAPFVARLPNGYREAITLVELRGLTQREAADVAGISLSGMKSRVQRGRRLMRAMFEECCELTVDGRGRVFDTARRDSNGCQGSCGTTRQEA